MSIADNDALVQDLVKGRITRWEFMTRGLALGLSASAVATLITKYSGPAPALAAAERAQSFSGKLVIFTIQNPPPQAQAALNKAYQAHQPKVTIVWNTKNIQPAQYVPILGTELASANTAPDIVSGNYVATYRGYVNLDQYRKSINPYTGRAWDQDLNWDFYRGVNTQGQRIMLASQAVHINWFYNKDMFAKAKVEPPKTWDELVHVCAELQKVGLTPVVSNYDYMVPQWFAEVYFDQYHIDWVNTVRAQPADWNFDPQLDGKFKFDPKDPYIHNKYTYSEQRFLKGVRDGKLRFDTPQMEAIVTNMAAIFPKYATKDFFVVEDPYPIFLQQGAAIMTDGSWALPTLTNDLAALSPARLKQLGIKPGIVKTFKWGTFENPAMQGKLVNSPVRSVESAAGEYVAIVSKNQPQTNLAVDFLMFWFSKAGYQPYLNGYAKSDVFNPAGPLEVTGVSFPPAYQKMFGQIKFLGNAEASYNGEWTYFGGGDFTRDLHGLLQNALQGTITPRQYAQQLQSYMTSHLAANVKFRGLTMADIDNPSRQPGT